MGAKVPPVKRNQEITLQITALGAQGQGIGRIQGYAVFVPGALPGETVRAHVIKPGRDYGVAKLILVEDASPDRIDPPCPLNGRCGGCSLQHMRYEAQLSYKRQVVRDALERIGGLTDIDVQPVWGMEEPWAYRNKGSFPLVEENGKVKAGFFAPNSHRVVPAMDCLIQQTSVLQAVRVVCGWADAYHVPVYDEETGEGLLRQVVARQGSTGDLMVVLVAAKPCKHVKELTSSLANVVKGLKSVYLNINPSRGNTILGKEFVLLWGEETIREELDDFQVAVGPASFLQVNHSQAKRLYEKAAAYLASQGSQYVIDAFCGIGTITLLLAKHAREVIGIENVPQAIKDARENALHNGVKNVLFICGDAERELPKLLESRFMPDALVMDPPRKGADEAFLKAIVDCGIKDVVYISCNPATLARDLKLLCAGGYRIKEVQPVDMFPHTTHVETVVLMSQSNNI